MKDEYASNLSNGDNWLKALLVAVYALIFYVASIVLGLVVAVGLVVLLVTGRRNENLTDFGRRIAAYLRDIMAYATLASEVRPFPFGEWPDEDDSGDAAPAAPPPAAAKPEPVSEPAPDPEPQPEAPPPAPKTTTPRKTSKKTGKKKATRKKASKKTAAKKKTTRKADGDGSA